MFSFFFSDDDQDIEQLGESATSYSFSSTPQNDAETEITAAMMDLRDRIPHDKEDSDKAEKALARELVKLSNDEREKILFDVHGISIKRSISEADLTELHKQLSLVEHKQAYERALQLNRAYVESFEEMFLHAEQLDAKKAAECLVLHFQVKQELFVPENHPEKEDILTRDVTWADLNEEDRVNVMSGFMQMSPKRDASGRTVIFMSSAVFPPKATTDGVGRAIWYIAMSSILTDPAMPATGSIFVSFNLRDKLLPLHLLRPNFHRFRGVPNNTVALHYGYRSAILHSAIVVFRLIAFAHGVAKSARFRFHYGNMEEIAFEMQTFGIPMDVCPVQAIPGTDQVSVSVAWHLEWLRAIQAREQRKVEERQSTKVQGETGDSSTENASETVIIPKRYDVLFGKSRSARDHPGSLRCRHLVRSHWEEYEKASRSERTKVADMIIATIHASGGRFLRPMDETSCRSGSSWAIVEHEVARAKVSHIFRHMRQEERIKAYNKEKNQAESGATNEEGCVLFALGKQNVITTKNSLDLFSQESDRPCAKQQRTEK